MTSIAGLTLTTAMAGNSVEVLENAAFFDVLLWRIRAAKKTVHLAIFLWKEGVLGLCVADALSDRARAERSACRRAQYVPGNNKDESTVPICVCPQNAIVRSSSLWMISSAFVTPASPIAPSA